VEQPVKIVSFFGGVFKISRGDSFYCHLQSFFYTDRTSAGIVGVSPAHQTGEARSNSDIESSVTQIPEVPLFPQTTITNPALALKQRALVFNIFDNSFGFKRDLYYICEKLT